jgi:hypothetical protein
MTRYQKVLWHHAFPDEPAELYSEIERGLEVRKVEVYRDGRCDYADGSRSRGTTVLGQEIMPSMDEINEDTEFSASTINAEEFEAVWRRATRSD